MVGCDFKIRDELLRPENDFWANTGGNSKEGSQMRFKALIYKLYIER